MKKHKKNLQTEIKHSLVLLNAPIVTSYGNFCLSPISVSEVKKLIKKNRFKSAIGHEPTANVISKALNINCPVNRISWRQKSGESAIVFKLKKRPPENTILSQAEIEKIGYTFSILEKYS